MSALDKAVAELDAKRSKDDAERRARQQAATAFLKEFFDADLAPSKSLKDSGVQAAFDGKRILLTEAGRGRVRGRNDDRGRRAGRDRRERTLARSGLCRRTRKSGKRS